MIKLSLVLVLCASWTIEGSHQLGHYNKNDAMPYKINDHYASVSYGNTYESKIKKTVKYAPPNPVYNYQSAHKMYPSSTKQAYSKPIYSTKKPVYSSMKNQYKPVYGQGSKTYKKIYAQPASKYQNSHKSNYYQPQQDMNYQSMNKNYKPVYNKVYQKVTTMHSPTKYTQKYQSKYASGQAYKKNQYANKETDNYKSVDYHEKMPMYQKPQNSYNQQYKPTYVNVQNDNYKMNEYASNKQEMKPYDSYKTQNNNQYNSMKYKNQEYENNYNENQQKEIQYAPSTYTKNEMNYMNEDKYPSEYTSETKYEAQPKDKKSYVVQYPSDNGKNEYQMTYNSNDQYKNEKYMQPEKKVYKQNNYYSHVDYKKSQYVQPKQHYYANCYSSEMRPIAGDCNKFEMCSNGRRTIMKCPSNLVYDQQMKICNHRHMVKGRCGSANYVY